MMKHTVEIAIASCLMVCFALGLALGLHLGRAEGRQECPMAVVPKCDFVFRGDKLIKTICPDSLGRMP